MQENGYYSLGLHPWFLDDDWKKDWKILVDHIGLPRVLAVGETGLDYHVTTDKQLQEDVFREHLRLANKIHKPVIIHCVKAWDALFAVLAEEKLAVPVIFHGFARKKELAKRIIDLGYYLSFGTAIQKEHLRELLREIPPEKFFLETDDKRIPISVLYEEAARALSVDLNSLSLQLQKNAGTVFGPGSGL